MDFPVKGGGTWHANGLRIAGWCATYAGLDVRQQLQYIRQWLVDNPNRLKTPEGMPRCINRWLKEEHRKVVEVRRTGAYREPGPRKAQATNYAELEKAVYRRCLLDGDTEEDARRIAKRVVEGMRK